MTPSESLMHDLVSAFPEIRPLLVEHLEEQEDELLPYLLMADIERWAEVESKSDPEHVARLTDWLEARFNSGDNTLKDLIGVGFVEMVPHTPTGDPILRRLGPSLRQVADDMGLFRPAREV